MRSGQYCFQERILREYDMEKINKLEITARYAETDMMGIIHHSVYPVWFEAARTEFIRMTGITYTELEKQGIMLPLAELTCKYLKPVHYEDRVTIETRLSKLSFAKIEFSYRVILDGTIMSEGSTLHGFVSSETFRPVNLKKLQPALYSQLSELLTQGW